MSDPPSPFEPPEEPPRKPRRSRADPEKERARARGERPTPTEWIIDGLHGHIASLEDRVASLEEEKGRLLGREATLLGEAAGLRSDLDRLTPELAELRQARKVAGWVGTSTTLIMFLGSCLISHAGTLPDGEAKTWYRALGWGLSDAGALVTILVLVFGWPPNREKNRHPT